MPLSPAQARHFCRRVGFAGKAGEVNLFTTMERAEAVDYVLAQAPDAPSAPPGVNNPQWWEALGDFQHWWIQRMIDAQWHDRTSGTPSPLEEKLTLFWHSHFATGVAKVGDISSLWAQQRVLRNRAMGSFHSLLEGVCTNGAILTYLDNDQNTRWEPQENFARELMELYTIGPHEFAENDVIEMTRAWTGHGVVGWIGHWVADYEFHRDDHDRGSKTIFGQTANWSGPDTLPLFTSGVKRDATAVFIARKLWQFFVNDEPTAGELQTVVNAFLPGLGIRDALRAILMHDTFWANETRFALTRSPIEFVVDMLRRLRVAPEDTGIRWSMGNLRQELLEPPSVAGWGTGGYWVSTQDSWARAGFLSSLRWDDRVHRQFDHLENERTAADAAEEIIRILGIPSASATTRSALETFCNRHMNERDRWALKHNAVVVGGMMPELHVA